MLHGHALYMIDDFEFYDSAKFNICFAVMQGVHVQGARVSVSD